MRLDEAFQVIFQKLSKWRYKRSTSAVSSLKHSDSSRFRGFRLSFGGFRVWGLGF